MKNKILFTITEGRTVKNLLGSGLLQELSKKYEIWIYTNLSKCNVLKSLTDNHDIRILFVEAVLPMKRLGRQIYNALLGMDTSMRAFFRDKSKHFVLQEIKRRSGIKGLVDLIRDVLYPIVWKQRKVALIILRFFCRDNLLHKQLVTISPQLVISCSVFTMFDQLLLINLPTGIAKTVLFMNSWDNFNSGHGYLRLPFDEVWVWGKIPAETAIRYQKLPAEQVRIVGLPLMDQYENIVHCTTAEDIAKRKQELMLPSDKRVIMFFGNAPCTVPREEETIDSILAEIENGQLKDCVMLLRLNPGHNQEKYRAKYGNHKLIRIQKPTASYSGLSLQKISKKDINGQANRDYIQTLMCADVVVTIISMVVLDSFVADTPVVNYSHGPDGKLLEKGYEADWYKPFVQTGAVAVSSSSKELMANICLAIDNPSKNHSARQRAKYLYHVPEGKSTSLISERIEQILQKDLQLNASQQREPAVC